MSFQTEFKTLRDSYESVVLNNPVLNREQEQFIFAKIQRLKDRLFLASIKDDSSYYLFLKLVNELIEKNRGHEIFLSKSFDNEVEVETALSNAINFSNNIHSLSKDEAILVIKQNHIQHDIFEEVFVNYKNTNKNAIVGAFEKDLNLCIDKISLSNIKMLIQIVSNYKNNEELCPGDLFSEGYFGIQRAIRLFNYQLGNKFSTYASQWIKSSIGRAIADKTSLIRIPVNILEQKKQVDKIRKSILKEHGRDAEDEEVIRRMRKKVSSLKMLEVGFTFAQIDSFRSEGDGDSQGSSLADSMADCSIADENDILLIKQARSLIEDYIEGLDDHKERYYLKYSFGLNSDRMVLSKDEIIAALDISKLEYDRLRKKAIVRIKDLLSCRLTIVEAYELDSGWDSKSNMEIV